jgi:hypothetical protein
MSSRGYRVWPSVEVSYGARGVVCVTCPWRETQGGACTVLTWPTPAELERAKSEVEAEVRREAMGREERAN